jgi:toxin ParE1/3/4
MAAQLGHSKRAAAAAMKIRWTKRAIRSLASIHEYISKDSPAAAARVSAAVLDATVQIEQFPQSGRPGRIEGTRELVIPGLPYIVPYRVVDDTILLLSVIHTSRKWPKKL